SIAADVGADRVADLALDGPRTGMLEIAGPDRDGLDDWVRRFLRERRDTREVVTDAEARYFGLKLDDRSLTPGDDPRTGSIRFGEWLALAADPGGSPGPPDRRAAE